MRDHPLRRWLPLVAGLLLGGCEDQASNPEPTAPTAPAIFSAAAGAHVTRFSSHGPMAQVGFFIPENETVLIGSVNVLRGGPATGQQTFLYYSIMRCDVMGECNTLNEGNGLIRNRDFVVRGQTMTLHTNTDPSVSPGFEQTGSGGPILLQWKQTSAFKGDFRGSARIRSGGTIVHSESVSTSSSATASGTLLGLLLDQGSPDASVGTVREGFITIEKTP